MSSPKKNEAVQDAVVHVRGKSANNGAHGTGLAAEDTALGRRRGGIRPCGASSTSAKMIPLRRIPAGRGLGGPQKPKADCRRAARLSRPRRFLLAASVMAELRPQCIYRFAG